MTATLLVGDLGRVGDHVAELLDARGKRFDASRELDPTALRRARRVFLAATEATALAAAARHARRLDRVVLLSSGSVVLPPSSPAALDAERVLTAAGLPVFPIRPLILAGGALAWAADIRPDGVLPLAHPDAMTAPIHERDVAAVAVAALLGRNPAATAAVLTGPALLSRRTQAELLAAAAGRRITVEELPAPDRPDDLISAAARGASPATDAVHRILGRPAAPFTTWAHDHAAAFRAA